MADENRKIIRVSPESDKAIRAYAEQRGIEYGEASDALIATAVSRLNALKRYSKSQGAGAAKPPGKPKKEAKKKKPSAAQKAAAEAKKTARAEAKYTKPAPKAVLNGSSAHA